MPDALKTMSGEENAGPTYANIMDENGILHPAEHGVGPGNGDDIVWLFGENLEGFDVNFTWGYYTRCGKWHRGGEIHTHPEAVILCYLGLDPDDLEVSGRRARTGLWQEVERQLFNTPTIAVCRRIPRTCRSSRGGWTSRTPSSSCASAATTTRRGGVRGGKATAGPGNIRILRQTWEARASQVAL